MERMSERGSILIVSLWMLTILTVLALTFARKVAVESRLTAYQWDDMRLVQAAKTAVTISRAVITRRQEAPAFGALNQPWSQDPSFFKEHSVPGGSFTLSHRAGEETLYGMEDEAGRININLAPQNVLERLFAAAPGVARAVVDARRARPLQSVEELLLIRGMTPLLFRQVKDLVTVDGDGRVNLNTASMAVLTGLGLAENLTAKIVDFRRGKDGKEGTEDDGVFPTAAAAPALLRDFRDLSAEESVSLANALKRNLLTAKSGPLRLNLQVRLEDRRSARAFAIVVPSGMPPGMILHWHEGAP